MTSAPTAAPLCHNAKATVHFDPATPDTGVDSLRSATRETSKRPRTYSTIGQLREARYQAEQYSIKIEKLLAEHQRVSITSIPRRWAVTNIAAHSGDESRAANAKGAVEASHPDMQQYLKTLATEKYGLPWRRVFRAAPTVDRMSYRHLVAIYVLPLIASPSSARVGSNVSTSSNDEDCSPTTPLSPYWLRAGTVAEPDLEVLLANAQPQVAGDATGATCSPSYTFRAAGGASAARCAVWTIPADRLQLRRVTWAGDTFETDSGLAAPLFSPQTQNDLGADFGDVAKPVVPEGISFSRPALRIVVLQPTDVVTVAATERTPRHSPGGAVTRTRAPLDTAACPIGVVVCGSRERNSRGGGVTAAGYDTLALSANVEQPFVSAMAIDPGDALLFAGDVMEAQWSVTRRHEALLEFQVDYAGSTAEPSGRPFSCDGALGGCWFGRSVTETMFGLLAAIKRITKNAPLCLTLQHCYLSAPLGLRRLDVRSTVLVGVDEMLRLAFLADDDIGRRVHLCVAGILVQRPPTSLGSAGIQRDDIVVTASTPTTQFHPGSFRAGGVTPGGVCYDWSGTGWSWLYNGSIEGGLHPFHDDRMLAAIQRSASPTTEVAPSSPVLSPSPYAALVRRAPGCHAAAGGDRRAPPAAELGGTRAQYFQCGAFVIDAESESKV